MKFNAWARHLPQALVRPLFGDRRRHGLVVKESDPHWQQWLMTYATFYEINQRSGIGLRVNDAGYQVMRKVPLEGRRVLEIGPGDIRHHVHWQGRPASYTLFDVSEDMLAKGTSKLAALGIEAQTVLWKRAAQQWPFDNGAFDVIVSFYSFEHMYPFAPVRANLRRLLAPGGVVAGAIPCEGGLAWGLGRMLTSRRWFLRHTDIDPDKIICWEHPNFADSVLNELAATFGPARLSWWPWGLPSIDLNLIVSFIFERDESLS